MGRSAAIESHFDRSGGVLLRQPLSGEDFDTFPEAGWVLAPEAHGQGYGFEAAQAAHDWFDRIMPGPLVAMIDADHQPSQRLAARLGYVELRETRFRDTAVKLFRRDGPPARF